MKKFLLLITALFILVGINCLNAQILPKGSTWKYLDDGSDQGTAWMAVDFDDSGWASGPALLGYGGIKDADVATELSFGPDTENKYTTTYLRTTFDYTPTGDEIGYVINLLIDDGAVFYLNGVEAARWNMPMDQLNYQTFAVGWGNEYWGEWLEIDKSHIVAGTNTLAVEVHQGSLSSSDMGFDIEIVVNPGDLYPDNKYFIMDAIDDGEEEVASGSVDLGSSDLELATDGEDAQIIGLRFSNIKVNQGETITSASIQFTSDGASDGAVNLLIEGEKNVDSPFFTETDGDMSGRIRTTSDVPWSPPDWAADVAGEEQKTPDLAIIVQEIVGMEDWESGNHMTFFITGVDGAYRRAFTKLAQNDSGTSAVLEIITGGSAETVTSAVTQSSDDAEEGSNNGAMTLESSDLELGEYDTWTQDDIEQGLQTIGVRFNDLAIPQNASILSASIQFTADNTGDTLVQLTIYGEDVANAATFDNTPYNITTRTKTAESAVWDVPPWPEKGDAGPDQQTVDLANIVQAIVSKEDWASGNSMAFIMEHSGPSIGRTSSSNGREAESFDGTAAPILTVTFDGGGGVGVNTVRVEFSSRIYPNPTDGILNIENPSAQAFSYGIYSINGKLVSSKHNITGPTTQVDMSDLNKGMYIIDIRSAEKSVKHRVILK